MVEASDSHELKCDLAADVIRRFGTLRLAGQRLQHCCRRSGLAMSCVCGVDRDAYRPGDVVLYTRNGRLFVHRLVEMAGEAVVTRGDALLDRDPPVGGRSAGAGRVDRAGLAQCSMNLSFGLRVISP